jgi:hypothetical protein
LLNFDYVHSIYYLRCNELLCAKGWAGCEIRAPLGLSCV